MKRHRPEALAESPAGRIRWDSWNDLRPTETNDPAGTTGDTRGSGRTRELGRKLSFFGHELTLNLKRK